ncbi:MAG: MltA domain-containing protein [Planctomycetes bacterium]|nr:MltA domain-containing protein [Planctomycetota bacterium]
MRKHVVAAAVLVALVSAACKSVPDYSRPLPPGAPALIELKAGERRPDFAGEFARREEILPALDRSIAWTRSKHAAQFFPKEGITLDRAIASLERFREVLKSAATTEEFKAIVDEEFTIYKSAGWDAKGGGVLYTAYCTPILKGSRTKEPGYGHPLYSLPPDLVKAKDGEILGRKLADGSLEPYPTRAAIEANHVLEGQSLELCWLADPLDAYIAHVNGSAIVELPDGEELRLGYSASNGKDYSSLGQALVKDGEIKADRVSLASLRTWGKQNPEKLSRYLARNERFVFFTPIEGNPRGCLNFEVTPRRSIATDKELFPRAAMCFIEAKPDQKQHLGSFALDQDRGGAIRTAGRADIYLGIGPEVEHEAGETRTEGQLYYFFLTPTALARRPQP